jgi:hypothetical protein
MAETNKHSHYAMLVIPEAKTDEAVAALKHANVLSTGQSTGTDCGAVGMGWHCGDRDNDHPAA